MILSLFSITRGGMDDQTHLTDRIMQKTGLWSSGGKGSDDSKSPTVHHITTDPKLV